MVNPEELTLRGLRAYEVGRVLKASRVALVLTPFLALCLLESRGRGAAACLAFVLLGLAVWLRWRDRQGLESVTTGLAAGIPPLLVGVVLAHFDVHCGLAGGETYCTAGSALVGMLSGLVIPVCEARWRRRVASIVTAGAIAALAAAVGCVRLGIVGVASMLLGLALGSALGGLVVRRSGA